MPGFSLKYKQQGPKTEKYLEKLQRKDYLRILNSCAEKEHSEDLDLEAVIDAMDDDQVAAIEAILDAVEKGEDSVPLEVKRTTISTPS